MPSNHRYPPGLSPRSPTVFTLHSLSDIISSHGFNKNLSTYYSYHLYMAPCSLLNFSFTLPITYWAFQTRCARNISNSLCLKQYLHTLHPNLLLFHTSLCWRHQHSFSVSDLLPWHYLQLLTVPHPTYPITFKILLISSTTSPMFNLFSLLTQFPP